LLYYYSSSSNYYKKAVNSSSASSNCCYSIISYFSVSVISSVLLSPLLVPSATLSIPSEFRLFPLPVISSSSWITIEIV